MALVSTPAVLLRGHDYADSSRILRFFTRDHGLVSVVAKGIRGRSAKGGAVLTTFATGDLWVYLRPNRDLHTLREFSCSNARSALGTDLLRFAGASAVAELVLAHADQEAVSGLFEVLEERLDAIAHEREDVWGPVLGGLWGVTGALGFEPRVSECVRCGTALEPGEMGRFDLAAGGVRCLRCGEEGAGPRVGPVARGQLADLLRGVVPEALSHRRAHLALVSDFIEHHVASRPMRSLHFLGSLAPAEPEGSA